MSAKTVFISYSHQDKDLLSSLVAQLKALKQAGLLDVWVDTRIDAGEKWYPDIEQAMQQAAVAVCLVSEHFLASDFCTKHEVPFLLQRAEEEGLLIIPVLLSDCPWYAHRWIEERQMLPSEGQSVRTHHPTNPAFVFSRVARRIHDKFTDPDYRPPAARLAWRPLPPEKIDLTHLPETGAALFGRDETLTRLDEAWAAQRADTRVLAFKAQGGVGKSTLINHWLAEMRRDHFRGAARVFGWSFYSQGVREQGAPSADAFVAAALRFFGDEEMAASAASPWDKGQRLARLVGAERALLVLDGMEPLQSAQEVGRGKLRDPALDALLRGLAKQSAGLCLITTREPLAELEKKTGIVEHDLEQITPQAGRALLRALRVNGTDAELEALATGFGPHALAITLLGVYLHEQPGHRIGPSVAMEHLQGKTPVDRVLAGFEEWLGPSAELEALRLLGFFDRPADEGCLQALRAQPAIPGLTELLAGQANADWHRVLTHLEKLKLIHARHGDTGRRFVETHPLIREHSAEQVRRKNPGAWREGHRRLYEHLRDTTEDKHEPMLEDLLPLYQAVAHGCQAGLHEETRDTVYAERILRRKESYSTKRLGAFETDIGGLVCFFRVPWKEVEPSLHLMNQIWILERTVNALVALSRLLDASTCMQKFVAKLFELGDSRPWGQEKGKLGELKLICGDVHAALADAAESVFYADRSGDAGQAMIARTILANALHQAGRRAEAEALFAEAEQMSAERQPVHPLLYSLPGFRHCDLLLNQPERMAWRRILLRKAQPSTISVADVCRVVSERMERIFEWRLPGDSLLGVALDHLTLGRAALYSAVLSSDVVVPPPSFLTATAQLDSAVSGLRRAGDTTLLPLGLLSRACVRTLTGIPSGLISGQSDLDEAWDIAERGPIPLLIADIRLHRARLFFREANYPWESPGADLAAAEKLITDCGYHRRDEELAEAKAALLAS